MKGKIKGQFPLTVGDGLWAFGVLLAVSVANAVFSISISSTVVVLIESFIAFLILIPAYWFYLNYRISKNALHLGFIAGFVLIGFNLITAEPIYTLVVHALPKKLLLFESISFFFLSVLLLTITCI